MRSAFGKFSTFLAFAARQRREAARIKNELSPAAPGAPLLTGAEPGWTSSGHRVSAGETFRVTVSGHLWLSKLLSLGFTASELVWIRIGGKGPARKVTAPDAVYEAWADGPVEVFAKGLSFFRDDSGALATPKRGKLPGGVGVIVKGDPGPATASVVPDGWSPHWQIGEGRVYRAPEADASGEVVEVDTHGDVGIICRPTPAEFKPGTRLDWSWKIDELPSELPEDLAFTHDYLSIAVEFDNGLDLTYMWSASLPEEHVFQCPLDWWCDRETHWVVRSGPKGLGDWREESRDLWEDYPKAIKGDRPARIVAVWLIANSLFQRGRGKAAFKDMKIVG